MQKRWYRYQIYKGSSILFRNQAWLINNMDVKVLKSLAEIILGEHDFLSFSKYRADKKIQNLLFMIPSGKRKITCLHMKYQVTGFFIIWFVIWSGQWYKHREVNSQMINLDHYCMNHEKMYKFIVLQLVGLYY